MFFPTRSSTTIFFSLFSFFLLRTLYAKNIRLSTTVCGALCRKSVKPSPKSLNYPPNSKCRGNFATLAPSLKLGVGQVAGNLTSNYQSKDSRERDSICREIGKYSSLISRSLDGILFSKRSHHARSIVVSDRRHCSRGTRSIHRWVVRWFRGRWEFQLSAATVTARFLSHPRLGWDNSKVHIHIFTGVRGPPGPEATSVRGVIARGEKCGVGNTSSWRRFPYGSGSCGVVTISAPKRTSIGSRGCGGRRIYIREYIRERTLTLLRGARRHTREAWEMEDRITENTRRRSARRALTCCQNWASRYIRSFLNSQSMDCMA